MLADFANAGNAAISAANGSFLSAGRAIAAATAEGVGVEWRAVCPGHEMLLVRRTLALLIIGAWAGEYVADAVLGIWSVKYDLPLQLTDAISVISALALWTRRQWLVELCYLWATTAALQALITPDLGYTSPSIFYFTYFTYHGGAIVAACLLVFGERRYPTRGAVARAYVAALAWTGLAALADVITGGNYMYLPKSPNTLRS